MMQTLELADGGRVTVHPHRRQPYTLWLPTSAGGSYHPKGALRVWRYAKSRHDISLFLTSLRRSRARFREPAVRFAVLRGTEPPLEGRWERIDGYPTSPTPKGWEGLRFRPVNRFERRTSDGRYAQVYEFDGYNTDPGLVMRPGDVLSCPQCEHESYVVNEYFPATRIGLSNAGDPESWSGRCMCAVWEALEDQEPCDCDYEDG